MKDEGDPGKRQYRMRARAEAAEARGERILDAAEAVFFERPLEEITLVAIAEQAGVSVQTVIRRFTDRQGLFAAVIARTAIRVSQQRGNVQAGDIEGAARVLVEHYEEVGDGVLRLLAQEERDPNLRSVAEMGRGYHRDWCKRVFGPALRGMRGAARERRLGQLVVASDVYAWKLLRRDCGLSRAQTELAMRELFEALMGSGASSHPGA